MKRRRALLALLAALALALPLAACSDDGSGDPSSAPATSAWGELLAERGLSDGRETVAVRVEGAAPALHVTISVAADAPSEATFGDGLYGAEAFTWKGAKWERVDTADVRTAIAAILAPGESATVELPVEDAESYRVLVPTGTSASWGDS